MSLVSNNSINEEIREEGEAQFSPSSYSADIQEFKIDESFDGHRLDFAVSRLLGISRNYAQKLIKEGNTKLKPERRIKPSIKVEQGDFVDIKLPPADDLDLEPQEVPFETVYEDNDIIVINKPAGLVVHPAPGHWTGTLVHGLLFRYPDIGEMNGVRRPGIVHRLDSTTSGLMVIARNGLAQEGLFREFKARRVQKIYLAMCYGTTPAKNGSVKYPIGRDRFNRLRMACDADGREAWTDYERIWNIGNYTLVKCILHTGRTHQIRVHMSSIGCPLIGDKLYAPERKSPFGYERVFLHAWKLSFKHPRSGELMQFTKHLSCELSDFIKRVRENGGALDF